MRWNDRVKCLLKQRGMTQNSLISILKVNTQGAVGHYLNGRREPSYDQLVALADALGCTTDFILKGEDKQTGTGLIFDESNLGLHDFLKTLEIKVKNHELNDNFFCALNMLIASTGTGTGTDTNYAC